jgi:hypothetical protein
MEEVEFALPEDGGQVFVELCLELKHFLLGLSTAEFLHESINIVTCVVSIRPLLELKSKG